MYNKCREQKPAREKKYLYRFPAPLHHEHDREPYLVQRVLRHVPFDAPRCPYDRGEVQPGRLLACCAWRSHYKDLPNRRCRNGPQTCPAWSQITSPCRPAPLRPCSCTERAGAAASCCVARAGALRSGRHCPEVLQGARPPQGRRAIFN